MDPHFAPNPDAHSGRITDEDASQAAQDAISGHRSELDVRWLFLAEVRQAGIAAEEALRYTREDQMVADLTVRLDELLADRIVGIDCSASLDLGIVARGSSLHGWARQFSRGSAPRVASNIRRKRAHEAVLTEDQWESLPAGSRLDALVDDTSAEALASSYAAQCHNMRRAGLVHLRARIICETFGLPAPPRLIDVAERQSLLDYLGESSSGRQAARKAAAEVGQMWDGWAAADRARLSDLDPRVACVLATAALTPTPPPQGKAMDLFEAALERVIGERARRLARAWVASVTETDRSEYSPLGSPQVKPVAIRERDRASFRKEARRLVRSGMTVLGTDPDAIGGSLAAGMAKVEEHLAAKTAP